MGKKTGDNRLAIEYVPLSTLERWPRNPKAHDDAGIARSVRRFGFNDPCARNTHHEAKFLLEGHGRLATLRKMHDDGEPPPANIVVGPDEWLVPTVTLCLPRGEAEAYALAHNQLTTAGGWDDDELASVISDLDSGGVDLSGLGWSDEELAEFIVEPGGDGGGGVGGGEEPPVDKAEELRKKWGTETGQVWTCGEHRIVCGDCTDPEVVAKVMGGEKAQGAVTSPPYAEQRKDDYGGTSAADYWAWWSQVQAAVRSALAEDGSFFVNIKPHCEDGERSLYVMDLVCRMKREAGWRFVDELYWTHSGTPGRVIERFKNQFEPIYHFAVGKVKLRPHNVAHESDHVPQGGGPCVSRLQGKKDALAGVESAPGMAFPGNVLTCGKNREALGHSAAFPVDLPAFFVSAYSDEGDVWLEPFLGSGTTMIACERLGRRCRGIELSPAYVAVCLERYFLETGKTPQLLA